MIKAVLLDLDDTLIHTDTDPFFARYLDALGAFAAQHGFSERFIEHMLKAYQDVLFAYDPTDTLHSRLMACLADRLDCVEAELTATFASYYADAYGALHDGVVPLEGGRRLLDWLFEAGYRVVIATNPGLPMASIRQRMTWGGIVPEDYAFEFITSLETMHFGKPQAEYYAEIVGRLGVEPDEAIMVGDNWEADLVGAAEAGLHTYWIAGSGAEAPGELPALVGQGTTIDFADAVADGLLDGLANRKLSREAVLVSLTAYPAVVDALGRPYNRAILECVPGEHEWSARDIICHLRDHEAQDRRRLQATLDGDNPFLQANTNPWEQVEVYRRVSFREALQTFAAERARTVKWLNSLPAAAWKRPARDAIFGPTCFEEIVRFIAEHDQTHLRQMSAAIDYAETVCGAEAD